MSKPKTLVRNPEVAGIAIHYARQPVAKYGTIGHPRKPRCTPEFREKLTACLVELSNVCPHGKPAVLVTAGMYVDRKNARPGDTHVAGRAVDIDALHWDMDDMDRPQPLITKNAPDDALRYLATEAVLRMHFGCVIDYWCNRAHRDHWHVDDGGRVGFSPGSKSEAVFAQAACLYIHRVNPGELDRAWGPKTRRAISTSLGLEEQIKRTDTDWWVPFLRATAIKGWGLAEDPWAG